MTLSIERAAKEDLSGCLALISHSIVTQAADHYSKKQIEAWLAQYPTLEVFETWQGRRAMFLARGKSGLVGFGQIEIPREEIVGVHVHPDSARAGIGSRLVAAMENLAATKGIERMRVQASLNAVSFYAACGYRAVEELTFQCQNGVELDALLMQKDLT